MRVFACRLLVGARYFSNMYGLLVALVISGFVQNPTYAESVESPEDMSSLVNDLLGPYNKLVVPSPTDKSSLNVTMSMALMRVIDFDVDKQILSLDTWMSFYWLDRHLSWSPAKYGGIRTIRVPNQHIWRPDILLYKNAAPATSEMYSKEINAVITYDGYVFFTPPVQLISYCNVNPASITSGHEVRCNVTLGSWAYDGFALDLQTREEEIDMGNFDVDFNRKWELVDSSLKRNVIKYACCAETYIDITYTLALRYRG